MTRLLAALAALAVLTLARLWLAAVVPLAPDEAYYWTWSRALAPGYLDHPPMVALWIRAGTDLVGARPIGVRLLGPLSAAIGSVLLYDAAERLFPARRAGLTAALLLNATLMLGVGAVIMTPDTPLLLFWTATVWAASRIATGASPAWWLAAGVFAGLALDSKYTAAFLPIGLLVFALLTRPRSLRRPEPWLGALIAAALFLPVIIWNAQHDWVGFLRQGGRVGDWRPARAFGFLAELVGGQIGLATPGVFVLFVAGSVAAVRSRAPAWSLLSALTVPAVLVFAQHAIGDRVQANWPAILYPGAAIAAAGLSGPVWRRWIAPSAGLGFALCALVYVHVATDFPSIAGDPTDRQLSGWADLAATAEASRQAAGATFIAAEPYSLAAELAWTLPPEVDVIGTDDHWIPTRLPRAGPVGPILLIRPERYGGNPDPRRWTDVTRLPGIARTSAHGDIERYVVFLVHVAEAQSAGAVLPHR